MLARHGAKVAVNDLGVTKDGQGEDSSPAQQVLDEIIAAGGQAVANTADVSGILPFICPTTIATQKTAPCSTPC